MVAQFEEWREAESGGGVSPGDAT